MHHNRLSLSMGAVFLFCFATGLVAQENDKPFEIDWKSVPVKPVISNLQISSAINQLLSKTERSPILRRVDKSTVRGSEAMNVYRNAAPSIVYVTDGESGHGTGFFVRKDGWIVTNHHVIAGMRYSPENGVREARIVTGKIDSDEAMSPNEGFFQAEVYRVDETRDLALLKINNAQDESAEWSELSLAETSPPPGTSCIAIGHPAQGVLWTIRQGEIAGRGHFPRDQINELFLRGADANISAAQEQIINSMPSRKVFLSTCGLNPGDSGGPLLDLQGKVVAVSYAVPTIDSERGIDLGKFSYHVHLDELKQFLADWPDEPDVIPPPILPPATIQTLADLDGDSWPEAWVFGVSQDDPPTGIFLDLDLDGLSKMKNIQKDDSLVGKNPVDDWEFELAFGFSPYWTLFADRNNDGMWDCALVHCQGQQFVLFERKDDQSWSAGPWIGELDDFPCFENEKLLRQYQKMIRGLKLSPTR